MRFGKDFSDMLQGFGRRLQKILEFRIKRNVYIIVEKQLMK